MSVQNPERLATKQDLKDMYDRIRPYMGGLPEVVANKFSKGDLYSTDEKMIGQWINGKPLYQRAFSLTIPTSDDTVYIAIESDIEDCIEVFGYASFGDGTWMCLSNSDLNNKRSFYAQTSKSTSSSNYGKLRFFFQGTILHGKPAVIVAKYTKVSDTAISIGSDTDYSTDEKIIGTWIDGSPVYQKTFTYNHNAVVSGGNIDISNVDKIIDYKGIIDALDGNSYPINYNMGDVYIAFRLRVENGVMSYWARTNTNATFVGANGTVTVQYTKTT